MERLFAIDGRLLSCMGKIADMVLLNIIWILCCIPLITIGSATTALYYVMLKMVRDEESYVVCSFFRAFVENFRQSTIVWIIFLGIVVLLGVDFYFWGSRGNGGKLVIIILIFCSLLVLMIIQYVFPIQAVFKNSIVKVLKNACFMATAYLPYTLAMLTVSLIPWLLLFFGNFMFATFVNFVISFAFVAWINAHFLRKLFEKFK